MTRSSLAARRVALPLSAAMLGGTLAAVGFAAPAHAGGSQSVSKSYDYTCRVIAGGLDLRTHTIGVTASAKIPATVYGGEKIKPTPVSITLAMPETLRSPTYGIVGGRWAEGNSTNAAVTLTSNGKTLTQKIPKLAAPKTAVPSAVGAVWSIPAKGTVPTITSPSWVSGTVTLGLPAAFFVNATIYTVDGDEQPNGTAPATLDCTRTGDLALGSIKVVKDTTKPRFSKRSYAISTKKNKKKTITVKATDALGDKVTYKLVKKTKKGSVSVKGGKVTFKPKKNFKGKTSFYVGATDGRTGWVKVKVNVKVKK